MSNNIGILKVHLHNLERSAQTMERVVYNALVELEFIPGRDVPSFEQRIIRKLERLDELQDEIDAVRSKLKEAGEHQPVRLPEPKYEYKRPKYELPEKPKRKPRKVYPVNSPKPAKAKTKPAPKPKKEPKPKVVRPPKVARVPKPRKPAESREMKLTKKRRDAVLRRMRELDGKIAAERESLLTRLEERKARIAEVANQTTAELGPQNRRGARLALAHVERQLAGLDERHRSRLEDLTAQHEKALKDIDRLLIENNSQV